MKTIESLLLALACAALAPVSQAAPDEARVLAALRNAHPQTRFSAVARTPVAGLYEVWMGTNVAYVSGRNPRYLLFGHLWDAHAMQDLTAARLAQAERRRPPGSEPDQAAAPVPLETLPLADAITRVKGDGSRVVALFSDPACGYCRRLEAALDQLDNLTIHTFLLPFQGAALPAAIWCAADRAQAWQQAMRAGDSALPDGEADCPHPLERNLALAQRFKVRGTPTLLFADGSRLDGYADAGTIASRLAAAARPPSSPSIPFRQEVRQ